MALWQRRYAKYFLKGEVIDQVVFPGQVKQFDLPKYYYYS
jgi:hypothetical protein